MVLTVNVVLVIEVKLRDGEVYKLRYLPCGVGMLAGFWEGW